MMKIAGSTLALLLLVSCRTGAPQGSPTAGGIEAAARAFMAEREAPAVSIAVIRNGEVAYADAFGLADLENAVPASEATVFRIASVTKPMTATAVMQLVESGKIDLSASIQQYVPAFPRDHGAVTIRDLLRHTGGVRHFKPGEFATTRRCDELEDGLAIFAADAMDHAPGERVTYSTYGYVLLGLAVENTAGTSFATYLRERVFDPSGMTATRVDDYRAIIPNRARGYAKTDSGGLRNADLVDTSCRIPGGGLISTATDVARFGAAFLEGRLLPSSSLAEMTTSQIPPETVARTLEALNAPAGYIPPGLGFGWAVGTPQNSRAVWHGGNQQGASSILYLLPDSGLSIAILTNLEAEGDAMIALAETIAGM